MTFDQFYFLFQEIVIFISGHKVCRIFSVCVPFKSFRHCWFNLHYGITMSCKIDFYQPQIIGPFPEIYVVCLFISSNKNDPTNLLN